MSEAGSRIEALQMGGLCEGLRLGGEQTEAQAAFLSLVDRGSICAADIARGREAIAEAALGGCSYSCYVAGLLHAWTAETAADYEAGFYWFRRAAQGGVYGSGGCAAVCKARLAMLDPENVEAASAALGWCCMALDAEGDLPNAGWLEYIRDQILAVHPELEAWEGAAWIRAADEWGACH